MRHPEILLLPVLMFADYYLTLAGAILRDRGEAGRLRTEHYELNPVLQKSIRERRWFSARHFAGVIVATGLLLFLFELGPAPDELGTLADAVTGFFLVFLGALVGRHMSNILIYRRMNRATASPTPEVSGTVTMSHAVSLSVSAYQYMTLVVPATLLAVVHPAPAALGGCFGAWMLLAVHGIWIWKHRRRLAKTAAADAAK